MAAVQSNYPESPAVELTKPEAPAEKATPKITVRKNGQYLGTLLG